MLHTFTSGLSIIKHKAQFTGIDGALIELLQISDNCYKVKFSYQGRENSEVRLTCHGDFQASLSCISDPLYSFTLFSCSKTGITWKSGNMLFVWKTKKVPEIDHERSDALSDSGSEGEERVEIKCQHGPKAPRGAKQAAVRAAWNILEPALSKFYAKEHEYCKGKNGKHCPPALRGPDVVLVPAKKMPALKNIGAIIDEITSDKYNIQKVSRILQRKNENQLKGYLIYFKLESAEEADRFLTFYRTSGIAEFIPNVRKAL